MSKEIDKFMRDSGIFPKQICYGRYCETCRRKDERKDNKKPCPGCMIYYTIEDDTRRYSFENQETKIL